MVLIDIVYHIPSIAVAICIMDCSAQDPSALLRTVKALPALVGIRPGAISELMVEWYGWITPARRMACC